MAGFDPVPVPEYEVVPQPKPRKQKSVFGTTPLSETKNEDYSPDPTLTAEAFRRKVTHKPYVASELIRCIKDNQISYTDVRNTLKFVLFNFSQDGVKELAEDVEQPFFVRMVARSLLADWDSKSFQTAEKLLERLYGKSGQEKPDGEPEDAASVIHTMSAAQRRALISRTFEERKALYTVIEDAQIVTVETPQEPQIVDCNQSPQG
jgi:hypothetical protein